MATIKIDIVSAEGEIHSGNASMIYAPAQMGEVGIAPRHAPLLTSLKPGEVRVEDEEGKEHFFYITGGMLEVQPHIVTVLADTAVRGDELDEAAAESAKKQAEEASKYKNISKLEICIYYISNYVYTRVYIDIPTEKSMP